MKLVAFHLRMTFAVGFAAAISASDVSAQQRDSSGNTATAGGASVGATHISAAAMDSFAAANIAIAEWRSKVQAELAEPRSKKAETQAALREKLQAGTERLLKEHNLTDTEFTRLTRRVSTDDAARKQFEEAMSRLAKR